MAAPRCTAIVLALCVLPTVFGALLEPSSRQGGARCGGTCKFYFCDNPTQEICVERKERYDVALTGPICAKDVTVGIVGETGEALYGPTKTPVSQVGVGTFLTQATSPSFFKAYENTKEGAKYRTSGIGFQQPQGNVIALGENQPSNDDYAVCVTLPILSYQVVDPKTGFVIDTKNPPRESGSTTECINFTTRACPN